MAGGGELLADYRGLSVTGLVEALRVLPRSLSVLHRLVDAARSEKPQALVVDRFPRFQLPARRRRQEARHPRHLLHQPAVLGLAEEPDAGDEAHRRSRARDFSVRRADLSASRRAGGVRRPSAGRSGAGAGAEGQLSARARARSPRRPSSRLLPGSRPNEVERLLPVMRDAGRQILARLPDAQFVIARAPSLDDRLFSGVNGMASQPVEVLARTDDVLAVSRRGDHRVGHRDRSGRAARPADGGRLSTVASELSPGPAIRARRYMSRW